MSLIYEEIRAVSRHALLHGPVTLARNAARSHDDLGAAKDVVDFSCSARYVVECAYYGVLCGRLDNLAFRGFENSECQKLTGDLRAQGIRGHDNK